MPAAAATRPAHGVAVVTIVRDRRAHLAQLLRGLRRCRPLPGELVVVDMGSSAPLAGDVDAVLDGTVRWQVVDLGDGAAALPLAAARNLGAATAEGERLVFLDVDCIPAPDLIGAYAAADPAALACAPVRYLERGWHGGRTRPDLDPATLTARSAPHPARPAPDHDVVDGRYELFWSLSFGLQRAVWDRIGGFDTGFVGYGGEDTDFACGARARDVPLQWLTGGTAFHQWHRPAGPPVEHLADVVANARRFHAKWGTWPMEGWLAAFAAAGLVRWESGGRDLELLDAA